MRYLVRFLFGLSLSLELTFPSRTFAEAADKDRLNVVFILVDDLGWSDLGCYGSDFYETPHVDRLAQQSLRFASAYAAAPVCSPTRAAIMTGKSPARLDLTIWHEGAVAGGPVDRMLRDAQAVANLPREERTLAELFRQADYFTAHVGKWHLGTAAYYPETQGFRQNIGGTFWGAPATFFFPFSGRWNRRDPEIRYVPGLGPGKEGDYLPDRLTDEALKIIESQQDRPFFLNLWYYTVHSPIQAPQDLVDRFRKKTPGKRHKDPVYAAMVNRMDHNVGRILNLLDDLELSDKTIVIFTSDNGGVDFDQRSLVPTSNLPLRSGKGTLYEGGLRIPLLIRWPGKRPGVSREFTTSQDFYATLAAMLGRKTNVEPESPTRDGTDLMPVIDDPNATLPARTLYWHFPHYYPRMTPASALRDGDWKLHHFYEDDRLELYNLRSDVGEKHNLRETHSQMAKQLADRLDRWRQRMGANVPRRNDSKAADEQ